MENKKYANKQMSRYLLINLDSFKFGYSFLMPKNVMHYKDSLMSFVKMY